MARGVLILLWVCLHPISLHSAVIQEGTSLDAVLQSSLRHYPRILSVQSSIQGREAMVLSAQGTFDPRIEGSLGTRMGGFYSGDSFQAGLVQDLPFMNLRLFGGWRISDGSLPLYESAALTQNGGEARVGLSLSLWRDRDIDARRARIRSSELELMSASHELTAEKLRILRSAYVAYAQWLLSARLHAAYVDLLGLATTRGEALRTSVAAGDIAEILLVENEQSVLQRQGLVMDAKRQLDVAAEQLALFFRNEEGLPILPLYSPGLTLPSRNPALADWSVDELVQRVVSTRPEIRMLELAREQTLLKESLAINSMKPELNLRMYSSRDLGSGLLGLAGTDQVADLAFSVPLRTREASGKAFAARAEAQDLGWQIVLLQDQIQLAIRSAFLNLEATMEMERLAVEELRLSEELASAESQRIAAGISDFFLLNIRERQIGEALLKRWQAHLAYQVALADVYASTMFVEGFGLGSL
jgi:outer membrane protein TolC